MDHITNGANSALNFVAAVVIPSALILLLVALLVRRRVTPPQLVFDEFKCDDALCPKAVLQTLLINEISVAGSGHGLEQVADSSSMSAVDVAAVAGDRAQWIAALIEAASIRRRVRVSGIAFQTGDHDAMITMTITQSKVVTQSHTFRNSSDSKSSAVLLRELVHEAASWTHFEATRVSLKESPRYLGTRDWRSWACFRRGVWCYDHGALDDARASYHEALKHDPDNWGALINLASLDARDNPARALERLQLAEKLLDRKQDRDRARELEPGFYRLKYLVGIVHLNLSVEPDEDQSGDHRGQAVQAVAELVAGSASTRSELEESKASIRKSFGRLEDSRCSDLKSTIGLMQPTAIALLASAQVNNGMSVGARVHNSNQPVDHKHLARWPG